MDTMDEMSDCSENDFADSTLTAKTETKNGSILVSYKDTRFKKCQSGLKNLRRNAPRVQFGGIWRGPKLIIVIVYTISSFPYYSIFLD